MATKSPLTTMHENTGAVMRAYGPQDAAVLPRLVEVYSAVGREYAAIRKSAAIFDWPHRSILTVTGTDRLSFLNRMLTQELKGLEDWQVRRSFWLNRKGRIDADLTVIGWGGSAPGRPGPGDQILLDVDVHAAARTVEGLGSFIIADDVQIVEDTARMQRLALHGPGATAILGRLAAPLIGSTPIHDLAPDRAGSYSIGGQPVLVWRQDATGEPGFEMAVAVRDTAMVYELLAEDADDFARPDRGFENKAHGNKKDKAVRGGWHAFNTARIEAGTPIYNIDFGPGSLPHETGVIRDRVSFKKGCYLGQEVVARMESLGHPKQQLVALRVETGSNTADLQPVTGTPVMTTNPGEASPIGAVTSSAISPMLSSRPICFAMVKFAHANAGARLELAVGDSRLPAVVQDGLAFWKRG